MPRPRIAFVTTCKNRAQHLKITLPKNLADNAEYENAVFAILNYGSGDDLLVYLQSEHGAAIRRGRVVVYNYSTPGPFRMAHAKNMAHRLGIIEGGEILVNLDADNLTGPGFASYVADNFERPEIFMRSVWPIQREKQTKIVRGCSGRIAVSAKMFINAGGYNEHYDEWGPDDRDFTTRLEMLGLTAVEIDWKYLDSIPHTDKMRFREYPQVRSAAYDKGAPCELEIKCAIANFGRFGCGLVSKNFWDELFFLEPVPTRIFGIGMHKTATTSLFHALEILGYDAAHWDSGEWAKQCFLELRDTGRSATMDRHYAVCDLPFPLFFKGLDAAYPGSKFILTIRNPENWIESVEKHWDPKFNLHRWEWDVFPAANIIHHATYGRKKFDREIMLARYHKHNRDVSEYFKNRPGDLLVMDMDFGWPYREGGAGWGELCKFLGRQIPDVPYPRSYASY